MQSRSARPSRPAAAGTRSGEVPVLCCLWRDSMFTNALWNSGLSLRMAAEEPLTPFDWFFFFAFLKGKDQIRDCSSSFCGCQKRLPFATVLPAHREASARGRAQPGVAPGRGRGQKHRGAGEGKGRGGGGASEPHHDPAAETSHVVSATVHLNCTCKNQVECLNTIDQLRVPASLERSGMGSLSFTTRVRPPRRLQRACPCGCGVRLGREGRRRRRRQGVGPQHFRFRFFLFSVVFLIYSFRM